VQVKQVSITEWDWPNTDSMR